MRILSERVNIKTFRGLSGLEEIAAEWNLITETMSRKRFFHLVDWFRCYLNTLEDEPNAVLFTIVYFDDMPEAIFPLKWSSQRILGLRLRILQLPSHPHMCLNDFIVARPERLKTYMPLVLMHLKEIEGVSWDYIYLPRVLEESSAALALAEQTGVLTVQRTCGQCDYLAVRPYDVMFRGFTTTFRNNLRRAKKRADQLGNITYTSASKRPELDRAYEIFLDIEASGWKGRGGVGTAIKLDRRLESFYRLLMERYSEFGGCEIHIMWQNEKPVAVEFSLITDGTLYTLKIGYDEHYASCSPGHLLREYLMKYCERRGDIRFNNLITDASWHSQWKPSAYNLFHYYFCKPTVRGWLAYTYQNAILQIRPLWLKLKRKLRNWNIVPGGFVRA
jgi:CelD/BcsL family acetyltransferase involved in cellulose biosynthesis